MYKKDYILRMIEMMGELVMGILGLIKKKEFKKASEEINTAHYQMLDRDAGFFQSLPLENMTEILVHEHNYTAGHLEILSELFYVQAELENAKSNIEQSIVYYKKSLLLREFVDKKNAVFSFESQSKILSLKQKIKTLESEKASGI